MTLHQQASFLNILGGKGLSLSLSLSPSLLLSFPLPSFLPSLSLSLPPSLPPSLHFPVIPSLPFLSLPPSSFYPTPLPPLSVPIPYSPSLPFHPSLPTICPFPSLASSLSPSLSPPTCKCGWMSLHTRGCYQIPDYEISFVGSS